MTTPRKTRLVQTQVRYRSYTENNLLWCESDSWQMILDQDKKYPSPTHYEKITVQVWEETDGWEPYEPGVDISV